MDICILTEKAKKNMFKQNNNNNNNMANKPYILLSIYFLSRIDAYISQAIGTLALFAAEFPSLYRIISAHMSVYLLHTLPLKKVHKNRNIRPVLMLRLYI